MRSRHSSDLSIRWSVDLMLSFVCLDDASRASFSDEELIRHVDALLARFAEYGVIINPAKCVFGASELDFLAHHVSSDCIRPLSSKVEAI